MVLHQVLQKLLLLGVKFKTPAPPVATPGPAALKRLIEAITPEHRRFDRLALHYGNRYRSGFWAIYLLSAVAVLCAVLPLALGWDDNRHKLHPFVGFWAVAEVLIISAVGLIYWQGHRRNWQGQWLRARTTAELIWYLPLLAPLVDFTHPSDDPDWYRRVFDPGQKSSEASGATAMCVSAEPVARECLADAWRDPQFVATYGLWTIGILEGQKHYHQRVSLQQKALQRRVHSVNNWLFGLTAVGALAHLAIHTLWLSLVTIFFPALGASLHGALAQSEAYRLDVTSARLAAGLQDAIDRIRAAGGTAGELKQSIEAAMALILEEHQEWHMLVRPHHLPLA